ncbi:MAG: ABC transporter permease, partial [Cellvibrionales bacterium]|nr:ABC transporter permease [Cellvibrionales bacterium]
MSSVSFPKNNTRFNRILLVFRDVTSRPSGAIGLTLVLAHLVLALISPLIVPYDYKAMNSALMLSGPDSAHWLGTDHVGRDVLTRVLLGGREALLVTGVATPIAVTWGGLVGIYFGLIGGRMDEVMMRVVDAFLSLPWILKMLVL